jgi:hypothetical protein
MQSAISRSSPFPEAERHGSASSFPALAPGAPANHRNGDYWPRGSGRQVMADSRFQSSVTAPERLRF